MENNNVLYSKDDVKKLLNECWDAADSYREQLDRIYSGMSNFDKPTLPNRKKWILNRLK